MNLPRLSREVPLEIRRAFDAVAAGYEKLKRGSIDSSTVETVVSQRVAAEVGNVLTEGPPPKLSGLTATGAFSAIIISWDDPKYKDLGAVEVYRAEVDNLGSAVLVGATSARVYVDTPPANKLSQTFYYWARAVSAINDLKGAYNATAGTAARTATDAGYVMEVLAGELEKVEPSANVPDLVFSAERFAVKTGLPGSTASFPFIVAGIPGQAGQYAVYMDTAFIKAASISNAMIGSLATDKLTAGSTLISAALIGDGEITNAKIGAYIMSTGYTPGTTGWVIRKDGTFEFNNGGTFRGVVQIAAGSTGASAFSDARGGANLLQNPGFRNASTNGWSCANNGLPNTVWGVNYHVDWYPKWGNAIYIQTGVPGGTLAEWVSNAVPVTPGKRYEFYAFTGALFCTVSVFLYWIDANGVAFSFSDQTGGNAAEMAGGNVLSSYKQCGGFSVAPAGAVAAVMVLRKGPTFAGANYSFLFGACCHLGEAAPNQTVFTPWSDGGAMDSSYWVRPGTTLVDGNKIYTGDAYVDTLQIKGQAVTVPVSSYTESAATQLQTATTIQSLTIDGQGYPIVLSCAALLTSGTSGSAVAGDLTYGAKVVNIYRGGALIYSAAMEGGPGAVAWAASIKDTPAAGNTTYTVTFYSPGASSTRAGSASNRCMTAIGVKR